MRCFRFRKKMVAVVVFVCILLIFGGCSKTKYGVTAVPNLDGGISWNLDDLRFAQDFRGVMENGTVEDPPTTRGEDYYNILIQNDLGTWKFKLWVPETERAASMDEKGVVRLISDYDSNVIRQIFKDAESLQKK